MNIGFDLTAILGSLGKNRGIGNYTISEFRELLSQDKANHYYALNYLEEAAIEDMLGNPDNLEVEFLWCGEHHELVSRNEYREIFKNAVQAFLIKNNIDIFYITSPFDECVLPYEKEWFGNVKVVATVYDVIPYVWKKHYLAMEDIYNRYMERIEILRFADRLLVISQSVKTDLIEQLNFPEQQIDVIWGAPDKKFIKREYTSTEQKSLYEKFGIRNKFIMCTGGDDDRKNLAELIQAYGRLDKRIKNEYQLVIACRLSVQSKEKYNKIIKSSHLIGRVILTDFVSDDELIMFYNFASLMAFPSRYEGFGLPVVEAFACGIPVLTSNNSSLVEIAGDAAIVVNPFDIKDIERGLAQALTKTDLDMLVRMGTERLNMFRWPEVAKRVRVVFANLATAPEEVIRKRIAMFTPLPPIPSGISDYSVDLVTELKEYFDIDIYIDQGYWPEVDLGAGVNIYKYTEFSNYYEQYGDVVYQMGNSGFHFYMYDFIKEYPGTVVLHDFNLHGAFYDYTVHKKKDMQLYRSFLLEDYDEKTSNQYFSRLKHGNTTPKIYDVALNGEVTNYANKIIVHSDWSKERLLQKDIGRSVRKIQLCVNVLELTGNNKYRAKYGLSEDDIIIASFGQIHMTKRSLQSLNAFARLCKHHDNIKYIFAGKLDRVLEDVFFKFIKENSLQDKVIITGFITMEEFEEYIDISDVCLNLRYPYQGETSGSLVRLLAKAKPVIVNDIGSFSELPDEACVKIPDVSTLLEEDEVAAIETAMERLVEDVQYRQRVCDAARTFAATELDVKIVAKEYKRFIEQKRYSILDENLLQTIREDIIDYDVGKLRMLSHTLAYLKE